MNLLDQLAGFCKPLSINLLDSPKQDKKNNTRQTRHHSVCTESKVHDSRSTKSIEKIQTWIPKNKQQNKQKVLFRLTRTLFTKVRKHYYTFWVNYQRAAKENTNQIKKQAYLTGVQRVIGFIQSYQAKQCQHVGLCLAFTKLTKFNVLKSIQESIQKVLKTALLRSQKCFFESFQQREKLLLKLQLFTNTLDMLFLTKSKSDIFNIIKNQNSKLRQKHKQKSKINSNNNMNCLKNQQLDNKINYAKKIGINTQKFKIINILVQKEYQIVCTAKQFNQIVVKTFCKVSVDKSTQNCPEINDNSWLFIEQPFQAREDEKQQRNQHSHRQNLCISQIKTKRCHSKPNLLSSPQIYLDEQITHKTEINLNQNELTTKKQYCTPKNRSISTYSMFNVDQTRISKLQKKIFGEACKVDKNQSRFKVNGQDWMNDRRALQEIMNNIKSPQRVRRNSNYDIQLRQLNQKFQIYKQNDTKRQKDKNYHIKQTGCQIQSKNDRSTFLKNLTNNDNSIELNKNEQKILISLKSKKKQSSMNAKTQQWRRLYQLQHQAKKVNLARK